MAHVDDEDSARLTMDYDVDVSTVRNMCGNRAIANGRLVIPAWEWV
jgi:hypothetical protein